MEANIREPKGRTSVSFETGRTMAIAVTARPLIDLALPQKGAARLGAQIFLAIVGTLLLTISAKTKVVLGPVDMSLQTLAVLLIAASFGFRLGVATLLLYLAQGAMGLDRKSVV